MPRNIEIKAHACDFAEQKRLAESMADGSPNPYASPETDTEQTAEVWSERGPFGLTEPIHAEGDYSLDNVRQALRLERGSAKTGRLLGLFGLMTLWCVLDYRSRGPADLRSLTLGTVVAVGIAFVIVIWLAGRMARARAGKYLAENNRHREMIFGEETVTIRSATTDVVGAWTMFSKCTCSQSLVLLHLFPHAEWCFVPRSFFAIQEDWDLFVRLVRHKLPENAPLPLPASSGLPESVQDRANQTPAIRGQGVVELSEIRRARRYAAGNWARYAIPAGSVAVFLLPTLYAMIVAGPLSPVHYIPGIVAVALAIWAFFIQPRRQLVAMVQKSPEYQAAYTLTVSEEELWVDSHYCRTRCRWDCFEHFLNLGNLLLLRFRWGGRLQIISASFFTESDWQRLLQLVARKLPEK